MEPQAERRELMAREREGVAPKPEKTRRQRLEFLLKEKVPLMLVVVPEPVLRGILRVKHQLSNYDGKGDEMKTELECEKIKRKFTKNEGIPAKVKIIRNP